MPAFKLSDSGGGYGWIFEGYTDDQMEKMTDDEIESEVDFYLDTAVEGYKADLREKAEGLTYPQRGYLTAYYLNTSKEYEAYYLGFLDDEIAAEREKAISAGKARRESSRKIYDCHRPLYIAFRRTLEGDPEVWEGLVDRLAGYEVVLMDTVQVRPERYWIDGVLIWCETSEITSRDEIMIKIAVDAWLKEHGYVD